MRILVVSLFCFLSVSGQAALVTFNNLYDGKEVKCTHASGILVLPPGATTVRLPAESMTFADSTGTVIGAHGSLYGVNDRRVVIDILQATGGGFAFNGRIYLDAYESALKGFGAGLAGMMIGWVLRMAKRMTSGNVDV